jgi:hypothetical protein
MSRQKDTEKANGRRNLNKARPKEVDIFTIATRGKSPEKT